MPGSSLWLVPPPSHPLHPILTKLIAKTLPALYTSPAAFSPHLTLTSNIDPSTYGPDPQAWLDSLPLPSSATVVFERIETEAFFFRRCYLKVVYDGVRDLAAVARARGVEGEDSVGARTEKWLREWSAAFGPHVANAERSGDTPVAEAKLDEIEAAVREAGIALGEGEGEGEGGLQGWEGGVVWLVATDGPLDTWRPVATRTLRVLGQ